MKIRTDKLSLEKIIKFMNQNNLSKESFSKKYGFDCEIMDRICEREGKIELEQLLDIAHVMGVSIASLIAK